MAENNASNEKRVSGDQRREFLIHMYDQMFNDINRHIVVVWQSVGTLIAALALFSLVEKQVIPLDLAAVLIVMVGTWLLAHLQDAAYWYNRNLVMIANIERQFLKQKDLHDIQYYFGKHRRHKMIMHLRIQYCLGLGILLLVTLYHFSNRVLPGIGAPWENFEPQRGLPYFFAVLGAILLARLWSKRKSDYQEFLNNSPGIDVDTTGIEYGRGHPSN